MKRIILCADDYGQNSAVSQAVVELLRSKQLSATSCLVTGSLWPEFAKQLSPFKGKADIGIHFNLTEGQPLSRSMEEFFPLKKLLIKATLRQLDKDVIAAELHTQFDNFVKEFGQLPDFIDGHQHIHQLPIIRDVIFELYNQHLRDSGCYIRCTYKPSTLFNIKNVAYFKQLIIQLCGGIAFKRKIVKYNIPHNQSFAGIYHFSDSYEYSSLFPRFVQQIGDGGLIMCHPGLMTNIETDEIALSRHNEYQYFSSNTFSHECNENQLVFVRFKDLKPKQ